MNFEKTGGDKTESREGGGSAWLKQNSLDLTAVHFSGLGERADRIVNYEPGEWNENGGVIMYADAEGALYAIPSTEATREKLSSDPTFKKVEGKGVLNLNDVDMTWGGAEKNATNTALQRWRELSFNVSATQGSEAERERDEQSSDRDAFEKQSDATS